MARLHPVDPDQATGKQKDLLDKLQAKMGMVPNICKGMANSPAALGFYMQGSGALAESSIGGDIREAIAVGVGEHNGCEYCVAAHSMMAQQNGVAEDDTLKIRKGEPTGNAKIDAAVAFARKVIDTAGFVEDSDMQRMRDAGFDDAAIAEVVAVTALNTFTNWFNHVNGTELDFPQAKPLS